MNLQPVLIDALISATHFLLKVVPIFVAGVILAQLVIELKWVNKLSWLSRPIMRFGHLQSECGGSFVVALISPAAGHSMLAKYYDDRRIGQSELIVAAIVNTLPGVITQGKTTLPITIPLMGIFGLIHYGLQIFATLVKAMTVLTIGRVILPKRDQEEHEETPHEAHRPAVRAAFWNALHHSGKTVFRILRTMIPVTCIVFVLIGLGAFNYIGTRIGVVAHYFPVPVKALPIVAARLASPIGAYTMAGNLLATGVAAGREIVLSLLVGGLLATIVNVRYLIPYYCGIFGPRIGTEIILASTVLRILIFAGLIWVLPIIWL